ncbi:MAG: hypothetical protein OES57_10655, partial [Acidimicrobiia bacterium]|nr:hypothetical protein [Acidimicrobiia bacterium]
MPRSPFSRRDARPEAVDYAEPLGRAVERGATATTERWTDEQFRRQREADLSETEISSSAVLWAMVVCLTVAALLSSAKLVEITERQEFGWRRDVATAVAGAIDRIANLTGLNRPADLIADIRSQGDDAGQTVEVIDEEALGVEPVEVVVPTTERAPTAATTTTTLPVVEIIRDATPDTPVAIHLAGDSQAQFLGYSLEREGTDRGGQMVV